MSTQTSISPDAVAHVYWLAGTDPVEFVSAVVPARLTGDEAACIAYAAEHPEAVTMRRARTT